MSLALELHQGINACPISMSPDTRRRDLIKAIDDYCMAYPRQKWIDQAPGGPYELLRLRTRLAIQRLVHEPVGPGMVGFTMFYNMGYVIQTSWTMIGIDLVGPGLAPLVSKLDALFVTHSHRDHFEPTFVRDMLAHGKPVYVPPISDAPTTNFTPDGLQRLSAGGHIHFKGMVITAHLGDHCPETYLRYNEENIRRGFLSPNPTTDDVLMCWVDVEVPHSPNPVTILHMSDCFNKNKAVAPAQGRKLDVFLTRGCPSPHRWVDGAPNAELWRKLNESVGDPLSVCQQLQPRILVAGHLMEMNHEPNIGGRIPFSDGLSFIAAARGLHGVLPLWGERFVYCPGP